MQKLFLTIIVTLFLAITPGFSKIIVLENFNSFNHNSFGGWTSTFTKGKSSSFLNYLRDDRGYEGYTGKMMLYKGESGFSGVWMQTLDFKKPEKKWKTINLYKKKMHYLSFKIKPLTENCDFLIRVADKRWVGMEDSVAVKNLSEYIQPKKDKWQEFISCTKIRFSSTM